jgi:hypothetical protein
MPLPPCQSQQQQQQPQRYLAPLDAQLQRRRDKLLFACTHVLFNLAANLTVEEKMVRRGLVSLLLPLLGHAWADLVLLAVQFLTKLSLYEENIAQVTKKETKIR